MNENISLETAELLARVLMRKTENTALDYVAEQLYDIFFIAECIASARIEGNHTTLTEYVLRDANAQSDDEAHQIQNIHTGLKFVLDTQDARIDAGYIRELHKLVTSNLIVGIEGDNTPGEFRRAEVRVRNSSLIPPPSGDVPEQIHNLTQYIQEPVSPTTYLYRTAKVHHWFTRIHPFTNGNGRTARLLTYAMLIRIGLHQLNGWGLPPSAFFNGDREQYYKSLESADNGNEDVWVQYVLNGLLATMDKVENYSNPEIYRTKLLVPALKQVANGEDFLVLKHALYKPSGVRPSEIAKLFPGVATYTISRKLRSLCEKNFLARDPNNSRIYRLQIKKDYYLLRAIMERMNAVGILFDNLN